MHATAELTRSVLSQGLEAAACDCYGIVRSNLERLIGQSGATRARVYCRYALQSREKVGGEMLILASAFPCIPYPASRARSRFAQESHP